MAQIQIGADTRDRLRVYKAKRGDTYDEAIDHMLDEVDT